MKARQVVKRIFDFATAGLGLIVLSPLLGMVALLLRLTMGAPVLFRQQRPGLHGQPFTIYKFRTMRTACEAQGRLLPDAQRLTRLGNLLRKTSIDELPELWNVLKGDMSLVGPRPLLTKYLPYYTERERRRHEMRPGITGLAQISGRNKASWDRRLANDVWYVDNWSLGLDLRILLMTAVKVFTAQGMVPDPQSLMLNLDEERTKQTERLGGDGYRDR